MLIRREIPLKASEKNTTAQLLERNFDLKCQFRRALNDFSLVLEELEGDMLYLTEKYGDSKKDFVQRKDNQVERLTKFYNKIETIVNTYEILFTHIKIQNIFIEDALNGKIINDETFRDVFLNLNN